MLALILARLEDRRELQTASGCVAGWMAISTAGRGAPMDLSFVCTVGYVTAGRGGAVRDGDDAR
jgi:hypothetical protein